MFGLEQPPIPRRVRIAGLGQFDTQAAPAGEVGMVMLSPTPGSIVSAQGAGFFSFLTGSKGVPISFAVSNASGMPLDFSLQFLWKERPIPAQVPDEVASKQDGGVIHLEANETQTLNAVLDLATSGWTSLEMEVEIHSKVSLEDWKLGSAAKFTVVPA